MMTIYVAIKAENESKALEILRHENLCLEARVSFNKNNIQQFISLHAKNNTDNPLIWIGFQIELPEGNIKRM